MSVLLSTGSAAGRLLRRRRLGRPGLRFLVGSGAVVLATAIVVVLTDPFGGAGGSGSIDDGSATSLATVERRALSSQTQVDGTLGYADSSTVSVPAGTAPSALRQARQTLDSAQAALDSAQTTLAADEQLLEQATAKLTADRLKQRGDCAGDGAATSSGSDSGSNATTSPCTTAAQAVASDQQSVTSARQKVAADKSSVASAELTASAARQSLAAASSSAVVYDTGATYTMLPSPGDVVRRGRPLYEIGDLPVLLLYGEVSAWRTFQAGMSPGRDVAQLNANLRALGFGKELSGDRFTSETAAAITALQAAHGLEETGELPLGSVVFSAGPVRVKSVTPTVGQAVQAGAVLTVTSTARQVTIALDASEQASIKVGDPVVITLPSGDTVPGRVSYVGKVATTPSGSGADANSTPTIEVDVRPSRPAATGSLDQAPVQISITTATVQDALVVPVSALLSLAGGGYAVETVDTAGVHQLVPVTLGLFDDADGLVQVEGAGLHAGQRVVVPGS
jgi:multidrug resistance efflux pump